MAADVPHDSFVTTERVCVPTSNWLDELKQSFGTRDAACAQCARDWPRMTIHDMRSYVRRMCDCVWGSELLDYFGNQSAMAKPFEMLVRAGAALAPPETPAQGSDAFELVIHASDRFTLRKQIVMWACSPADEMDFARTSLVDVSIDIDPRVSVILLRQSHHT